MKTIKSWLSRALVRLFSHNMTDKNFQISNSLQFFHQLLKEIKEAKKRVWIQVMYLQAGPYVNEILEALEQALQKGVDVRLQADYYSRYVTNQHINYFPIINPQKQLEHRERLWANQKLFQELSQKRIITWINPLGLLEKMLPTRGRNHIKIYLIDDHAWIGGINLYDVGFKIPDIMVKITDPKIVEPLKNQYHRVNQNNPDSDYELKCTQDTTLLIDAGRKNQSLILNRAVSLVEKAQKNIRNISFFMPDGPFLKSLHKAYKRGVDVEVIGSPPHAFPNIFKAVNKVNYWTTRLKRQNIPFLFYRTFAHAKLLIVDHEIALVGSHNLSWSGVMMGTTELMLQSKDKSLIQDLEEFYQSLRSEIRG